MKILAISDTPSKALWDYCTKERLAGIDLILSCGDLPKKYLEYLTNFTAAPILYVHGNHDGSYRQGEPGGCICVDDEIYIWKGLRIMGLGGCIRYNKTRKPTSTPKGRCAAGCGSSGSRLTGGRHRSAADPLPGQRDQRRL